eukprot:TRINITY_DN2885_c0_g3_i1.p1 TRINITY_DN2885_c0_g3~~TRINITY_DN2885_c0_g3_i1.p1  ORF type:complete len:278 (-),score=43.03 TRINITY_DN2885_c0_g3_i1:311-1057(-)
MSAMMTVAVAPFVDGRCCGIGNTFLPEGRDHVPRARCHSFSHRTLTHDRQFQPPQRANIIVRSQAENVAESVSSTRSQKPRPMLLGRRNRGNKSVVRVEDGTSCSPSAQLFGTAEQFRVESKVNDEVAADDLADRCDSVDSDDLVSGERQTKSDSSSRFRACRKKSRKPSVCSCSTSSTQAPSSPLHSDESSAEASSSPSARQPVAVGPQQCFSNKATRQEELLKQLLQTGASAMARAAAMSKEMRQR